MSTGIEEISINTHAGVTVQMYGMSDHEVKQQKAAGTFDDFVGSQIPAHSGAVCHQDGVVVDYIQNVA